METEIDLVYGNIDLTLVCVLIIIILLSSDFIHVLALSTCFFVCFLRWD